MIKKAKEGLIGILQCIGLALTIILVLWLIYLFIITPWYVFWGFVTGILLLIFGVVNLIRGSSPITWLLPNAEKTPPGDVIQSTTIRVGEAEEKTYNKGGRPRKDYKRLVAWLKERGYIEANRDFPDRSDEDWEYVLNMKIPENAMIMEED